MNYLKLLLMKRYKFNIYILVLYQLILMRHYIFIYSFTFF